MTCLSCGGQELRRVRRYRAQTQPGRQLFARKWLCECVRCGLVQAVPRPDPALLGDYYSAAYWTSTHPSANLTDPTLFPRDNLALFNRGQAIAELVQRHLSAPPKRMLDVGAGYGHVLHVLGERYPNATMFAVEASERCRRHLESIGIQAAGEPIEEFTEHVTEPFDLIVLSHVLEHFLNPKHILQMLRSILSPRGVICVEVPNVPADLHGGIPKHRWVSRYDEPHITFFSTKVLAELVGCLGYRVLLCDTAGPRYPDGAARGPGVASLRSFLHTVLPEWVLVRVRTQRTGLAMRDDSFYEYGGSRIWLRCLAERGATTAMPGAQPRPSAR